MMINKNFTVTISIGQLQDYFIQKAIQGQKHKNKKNKVYNGSINKNRLHNYIKI